MSSNSLVKNNKFLNILKGAIVAISTTLILILLFAFLVRFANIGDKFIFPINQVIKVISLTLGIIVMLKNDNEKGFLKGLLLGITYYILSYLLFSILQARFAFEMKNIYDMVLTTLASGLIGIIIVNIKK